MNKRIKKKRKTEILLLEIKCMLMYLVEKSVDVDEGQRVIVRKINDMDKQVKRNSRR